MCVTGVTVLPVIFAVLLAHTEATRSLRGFTIRWQRAVLDAAREGFDASGELVAVTTGNVRMPVPIEIGIADLGKSGASAIALEARTGHRRQRGSSPWRAARRAATVRSLRGEHVFAWLALPDQRILLALSPAERLQLDQSALWIVFALLLLVSTGIAAALAWLLAQDVSRATAALRGEAERLASGDLRRGEVYESEDELGELSRSFEAMASSLRATVGRVSEAADRVEATAGEMAGVSEAVSSVTADQVKGIQQTTTSMEAINQQVRGIADSSQTLNVSVEESSSSILELGAAGEELNETASVLSGKVNEVSSSIEQMVRSVKQVLENTEALSEAAVETSASMEEMAMSMREVDVSAEETARLSHQVVASAESGQTKMVQAIEGMEAIREATETAERVIRNLGSRTREIGAIVDVIDDVADETNLLALNAAIIAAQAGEQGRAFSVVADEIKELADRVLASTKEIGGLIRAVQEEGSNAIGAIEKGGGERGVGGGPVGGGRGESRGDHARRAAESGTRIAGIVTAVREQAKAASHVVELMERVRGGVEQIRGAAAEQDRGNEVVPRQQRGDARGGAAGARDHGGAGAGLGADPGERGGRARGGGDDQPRAAGAIAGVLARRWSSSRQSTRARAATKNLRAVSTRSPRACSTRPRPCDRTCGASKSDAASSRGGWIMIAACPKCGARYRIERESCGPKARGCAARAAKPYSA